MVTLKDFIELDQTICGLDLDIRNETGSLLEIHRFGVGAWPGNQRDRVSENVYREIYLDREILIYLYPQPINLHQTDKAYRGPCRVWQVMTKKIPKSILNLEISHIMPFTAGFLHKENNGHYYSINLIRRDEKDLVPYAVDENIAKKLRGIEPETISIDEFIDTISGEETDDE